MAKVMRNTHDVYPTVREIDPTRVADLMIDRGAAACEERWHWLTQHAISDLATEGRKLIKAGKKWAGPRARKARGPRPGTGKTNRYTETPAPRGGIGPSEAQRTPQRGT